MASFLDKTQVNTAITDSTKLDLDCQHITTSNFMQLQPVYKRELVPGEKIEVNAESFTRLNPLAVPTFGRASMKLSGWFVPYRTIFPGFTDFITDAPHINSSNGKSSFLQTSVPQVSNLTLLDAITSLQASQIEERDTFVLPGTPDDYDLRVYRGATQDSYNYFKFSIGGMQAMKVLESLGYKINPNLDDTTPYSALPLLALAKVYVDWYWPQQYTNNEDYVRLLALTKSDYASDNIYSYYVMTSDDVAEILKIASWVMYDSDQFTSAWDTPNQPSVGTHSDFKLVNIDSVGQLLQSATFSPLLGGYVTNNSGNAASNVAGVEAGGSHLGGADAPFISPSTIGYRNNVATNVPTPISEYLLHALHSLTDYMKRHQLAGSAAFSRYLARYGKALPAEKLDRSIYLGTQVVPIQIGDVMSTADTEGAALGDYSGKGLGYGSTSFEFSTDEFGLFIITSSIVPVVGYFQGIDPEVKRLTHFDYYVPEMDNLGVDVCTKDMLYVSQGATNSGTSLIDPAIHEEAFGFLPRYWSYKTSRDYVTGNFRVPTLNGALGAETPVNFNGANSWYLMRAFSDSSFNNDRDNIVHSPGFMLGRSDAGQYNRIFYNAADAAPDQFTVIHNFNVTAYAPMKSLFDTYEFEDKGKKVTMDVGGPKMN